MRFEAANQAPHGPGPHVGVSRCAVHLSGPARGTGLFSPDGRRLASASTGWMADAGEVILWDMAGRRLLTLKGPRAGVGQLTFSGDGRRLFAVWYEQAGGLIHQIHQMWDAMPLSAGKDQ